MTMFPLSSKSPLKAKPLIIDAQKFLRVYKFYTGNIDGEYGPKTEKAVKAFQAANKWPETGSLEEVQYNTLINRHCPNLKNAPTLPPFPFLSSAQKARYFGKPNFKPYPAPNSSGYPVTFLDDWEEKNIGWAETPLYKKLFNVEKVRFNKKVANQLTAFQEAVLKEKLEAFVLSRDGEYVPRYIRGSRYSLSNHALGTAFDINAAWNGLGVNPPSWSVYGSVQPLVELAYEFGFAWGGYFSRKDGMHFEINRILEKFQ